MFEGGVTFVTCSVCEKQFYITIAELSRQELFNCKSPACVRSSGGGTKHDTGKAPLSLVPRIALELEARVMAMGAKKYGKFNYRAGFDYSRLIDAALRHITAFNDGQDNDEESGLSHLAHARCCLGMLLDCINLGTATDDRYKKETK